MHSLSPTPQLLKLDHYASGVALNLDGVGWSFLFILRELAWLRGFWPYHLPWSPRPLTKKATAPEVPIPGPGERSG